MSLSLVDSQFVATMLLFAIAVLLICYASGYNRLLGPAPLEAGELMASLPDGLVVLDERGAVTAANEPAPRLLAADTPDLVGRPLLGAVAGSPLEIDMRALLAPPVAASTSSIVYEGEAGMRAVELRLRPLRSRRSRPGSLLVVRDRTDRARMEQALEQRIGELVAEAALRTRLYEEARAASQAKSVFLSTVSHELRTPLTSIIGFTEMLDRGLFGDLPDRAHELLAQMRHNGRTMARLIDDLLDYSKIEAGHLTVALAPVDLAALIRIAARAIEPQLRERGLDLAVEIAPNLPFVYADEERLEQVLTNLLANAIKFTDRGSIVVRAWPDGPRVRFAVADTGIGIAPEHQGRLFQEFQRIERDGEQRPGTGLGLAISQRLMRLMGGELAVESALGVGSTFTGDLASAREGLAERSQGGDPR